MAHVENFGWDPITPISLSINDYSATAALTVDEAEELAEAILLKCKENREKGPK